MADDLELVMRSIDGEGPSPDFVTSLRKRIVAETTTETTSVTSNDEIELRRHRKDRTMTNTRKAMVGFAAAAIVLILGFVALGGGDDDGPETVDTPQAPTTTAVTETTVEPTTTAVSTELGSGTTPLPPQRTAVNDGDYFVESLGTPFTIKIDFPLLVKFNSEAFVALSHPASSGIDDRDIVFMRLSALHDPTDPAASLAAEGNGWPADDFGGWLDNVGDGMLISNREEMTLGGLPALRVDIECGSTCVGLGVNGAANADATVNNRELIAGSRYRIWVVPQDDQAPIAVIVGIIDESNSGWFDTTDRILSTIEFGEVAPNPIG